MPRHNSLNIVSTSMRIRMLWWLWIGACAVTGLTCAAIWHQVQATRAVLDQARASLPRFAVSLNQPAPVASTGRDFTLQLPVEPTDPAALALRLQSICRAAGALVSSLSITQHAGTPSTLGRVDLEVELKGNYLSIKQVLAQWLQHREQTTLRSLRLRSDPERGDEVQAYVVLSAWSRASDGAASAAPSVRSEGR